MAQTKTGAEKIAAQNAGLSHKDYLERLARGLKRCTGCKEWVPTGSFGKDRSRGDGLAAACRPCRKAMYRKTYIPSSSDSRLGVRLVPPRDGDKIQARGWINQKVGNGLIPAPNALPCAECGHCWEPGERRHEYHHHRGYAAEHHEDVIAVCTLCHARLEK